MHALQLGGDLTLAGMPGRGVTALLCFDLSGEASDPPQETAEAAEAALPRFRAPPPLQLHGFAQQRRPRSSVGKGMRRRARLLVCSTRLSNKARGRLYKA